MVGTSSKKCTECVRLGRKCDLSFMAVKWRRLLPESRRVRELVQGNRAEFARLYSEIAQAEKKLWAVEDQMQKIVDQECRNIAAVERLEEDGEKGKR